MIKKVGIVGAGTMGRDIAQVCAEAGLDVLLVDVSASALESALNKLASRMERQSGPVNWLERIMTFQSLETLSGADLVIESATEDVEAKLRIIRSIELATRNSAIIATNTSSLSLSSLAAVLKRPQNFVGLHFFNPATALQLVEISRAPQTSVATVDRLAAFTREIGKQPIFVKDSPGFVVNRLLCPMINEAIFLCQEGVASVADIDSAMQLGCRHPAGPLSLADQIGLDVLLAIMDVFHDAFMDRKYRAAPLLRAMVSEGKLGRKSGRGFYEYGAARGAAS